MTSPAQFGNLRLWLDAGDLTTLYQDTGGSTAVTATGQSVGRWSDKSGNGYHVTANSSPYATVNYTGINGNRAIYFNGGQGWFANSSIPYGGSPYSVYMVFKYTTSGNYARIIDGASDAIFMMRMNPSNNMDIMPGNGGSWISTITSIGTYVNVSALAVGTNTGNSSNGLTFYMDGTNQGASVNGAGASSTGIHIGGSRYGYTGFIAEILIYNSVLSTANQQWVEGYLAWKWGTNASLPSSHLYYGYNPTAPVPTSLAAAVTSTTASISFIPAPNFTVTNYQYSTDDGTTFTAFSPAQTTSPVLITGLTNNTTYTIRLKVVDSTGTVGATSTSPVTAITTASTPAAPTSVVAATAGYLSVSLAFTPPAGTISNYQYSLNGGSAVVLSPAQITSPIVIGGLSATTYTITLQAINGNGAGAASSSVSATPSNALAVSVSGLRLWMDSSDNSTLTLSGSTVTAWSDKSGNSNSATTISGSPSIATQYSNQYLNFNSSRVSGPVSVTGTTLSIFSVCIIPANGSNNPRIVSLGVTSTVDYADTRYAVLHVPSGTRDIRLQRNNVLAYKANTLSTPIIASSIMDGTNCTSYVNGTSGTPVASTGNFGITTYAIGVDVLSGGGAFFTGYIGEVLVYNSALTTSERQLIEGYLAWKWGINAQLPTSHPYYSINPYSPVLLSATVTSTTASIAFTPPSGTITNYQYSTDNGTTFTAFSPAQTSSPVLISGLTNNTTYAIRLKAVDSTGVGGASSSLTVITTASTPAAPTSVVATAGYLSVSLAFTPPAGTISNYQYSLNGGSYVVVSPAQITSPIVISGLSATSYTITLQAINGNGAGAASSSVSATPGNSFLWGISGLQLWYDGSDPNNTGTAPANGTAIATWKNKAPTGTTYDAVATVSPNGGFGGYPATYSAANKALYFNRNATYSTGSYPGNPTAETAFVVFNTANTYLQLALIGGTAGSREYAFGYTGNTGANSVGVVSANVAWICGTPSGSYTVNTTGIATFKQSAGTAYAALYGQNGNAYATGTMNYTAGSTTWLGCETQTSIITYEGYAMEIIFYNRVLSDADITTVQNYLYQKWIAPAANASISSGMVLWCDVADATTLTYGANRTAGSNSYKTVTGVRDKSGTSHNLVLSPSATAPIYIPSLSPTTIGDMTSYISFLNYSNFYNLAKTFLKPTLVFRGRHVSVLDSLEATIGISSAPFSFFGVFADVQDGCLFGSTDSVNILINWSTGYDLAWINDNRTPVSNNLRPKANYGMVMKAVYVMGSTMYDDLNGTNIYSLGWSNTTVSNFRFNGRTTGETTEGFISEILVYNRAVTSGERDAITGYLATKWGLQSQLPTSHPYYSTAFTGTISTSGGSSGASTDGSGVPDTRGNVRVLGATLGMNSTKLK